MSTFQLCADERYFNDVVDFSLSDDLTIPAVMLQTGSSRAAVNPGIYRSPRIRTYSDKFGTPTGLMDAKEITFSAVVYGATMDEIYGKWQQIHSYFDRAEIAASPFPRGTGVVLAEQLEDASEVTIWDVVSGVLTDVDFNLPGTDIAAAVVQLSVLPFSRGRPIVVPFGSTLTNGTNAGLYVPYGGGDAPGLFELRLSDQSASGHVITWVGIGRRWYPKMAATDFTPWYAQSSSITTSASWQQILSQVGNAGKHQTGLFGVYAIVNDASPVIGQPIAPTGAVTVGGGTIPNGTITSVIVPKNGSGVIGQSSPRIVTTIDNPNQPGDVQDYEGFEAGNWNSWSGQPATVVPGAGSASLVIDATAAIVGALGAHFKVVGDSTANSITSAIASRFMPSSSAVGQQSIAYKINPVSWGSWAAPGTPVTDPSVAPTISASFGGAGASYFTTAATYDFGYAWVTATGVTRCSPLTSQAIPANYNVSVLIPAFPATVTGAMIYVSTPTSTTTVYVSTFTSTSGFVLSRPGNGTSLPSSTNTTGTVAHDATPRFTWGGLNIVPTGSHNVFAAYIGTTQLGSSFTLTPGVVHQIGANFEQIGTNAVYSIIMDGILIGTLSGTITALGIPIQATWSAIGAGNASPFTEEYYLDEIYVYAALLQPNFSTTGSSITTTWANGTSTSTDDYYYSINIQGETATPSWYLIPGVSSPLVLTTTIPINAQLVAGPPSTVPTISYAQLQARVGLGSAPLRFLKKSIVRTKIAGGVDELVRLGSIEMPPGAKAEYRELDGWTLAIWGKSGGSNTSTLTVKGIVLFPEDEDGWTGITAKAFGLTTTNMIWHIGSNRFGRPYAQLFASDGTTLLGSADPSGAIGTMAGDEMFVVLTGRDDGNGNLIMDLAQTFQLGYQAIPRFHFENTEMPVT